MEEEKGEDHADPVPLHTVPLEQFKPGSAWVIPEASYFGGQVKLAGVIQRVEVLRNASYLYMHLTGTDSEDILKIHTGQKDAVFKGHICEPGCGKIESGSLLFHAVQGRQRRTHNEEPWVLSLEGTTPGGEDELAALRARGQAVEALGIGPPGVGTPPRLQRGWRRNRVKREARRRRRKRSRKKPGQRRRRWPQVARLPRPSRRKQSTFMVVRRSTPRKRFARECSRRLSGLPARRSPRGQLQAAARGAAAPQRQAPRGQPV